MADKQLKQCFFVLKSVDLSTYKRTICIFQIAFVNLFCLSSDSIIVCNGRVACVSLCFLCIFAHSDVLVSLHSVFGVVLFALISAYKTFSVRLNLQLFVGEHISYLRYLCLFALSGVHQILCLVFVLFFTSFVTYVASIYGLCFFYCPFGILYSLFNCQNYRTNQ